MNGSLAIILSLLCLASPAMAMPALLVSKSATAPKVTEPRVVLVREGEKTILTFTAVLGPASKESAWLLPVAQGVDARSFNVGDAGLVESLDRFTAARLIVARDENPCQGPPTPTPRAPTGTEDGDQRIGYTYVVGAKDLPQFGSGDYDVSVLSTADSARVATWLGKQGYKLSAAQKATLAAAVKTKTRFALARIKLSPKELATSVALKPLQVAYESSAETLPIAFGSTSPSDTSVRLYLLGAKGRTDLEGISTVRFPAGAALPLAVKDELAKVYEAIIAHGAAKSRPLATLEYAGDLGFCEPCVDEPPSVDTLRKLGVFWLKGISSPKKDVRRVRPAIADASGAVFVARWRLAFDAKGLKADPKLVVTSDRNEFHPRLAADEAHPGGASTCEGATEYAQRVTDRQRLAIAKLAELTGWNATRLERTLGSPFEGQAPAKSWVDELWNR